MHQPELTIQRAVNLLGEILTKEGQSLANYLRPAADWAMLQEFSLEKIMADGECITPTLCNLL